MSELTDNIKTTLETVPALYEDSVQPLAKEVGKTGGLIGRAINAALSPLEKWILNTEYNVAETKKLLEHRLANTPVEKIVAPEPYVAVPAFQAISYSMNSDELRELYANLLSKSMNSDTKNNVHPSYVEIIKQLSPLDAIVFKRIMESEVNPLIDLSMAGHTQNGDGYNVIYRNISCLDFNYNNLSVSFDNLERLRLISIVNIGYLNKSHYDSVLNSATYQFLYESLSKTLPTGHHAEPRFKALSVTDLGKTFHSICIQ